MAFNKAYSDLLTKLPASLIINEIRLTSRKHNLLSEKEAGEINPIVELFLKHEAIRYQKRLTNTPETNSKLAGVPNIVQKIPCIFVIDNGPKLIISLVIMIH